MHNKENIHILETIQMGQKTVNTKNYSQFSGHKLLKHREQKKCKKN